ncbi:glycosyltransferase [Emticicia sp. 21SJ11W-3]|uniref:glycosyltransferase n=1 Tax=Emticicia sp. 21SJ11W-3 TaxID=2916755 RepID=UPI0020A087F0|nr:glycosyltransferase [Emticicia sp. 21SJ11W-3]UTA68669.1 glycosyltransferase [Emticicia sp. 21SJ11W-3]
MPKVSIIVPIYNVEKYLHRCMDSLLNQTLQDIEIILVNDGSPDNSPKLCEEYRLLDSRIKVVHKENGGLGFARNSGIEVSSGEFLAFVDSDDYVDVFMFERLYYTAKSLNFDTVFCGFNRVSSNQKITPVREVETTQVFETRESILGLLFDMIGAEPNFPADRKFEMSVWHAIYSKQLIDNYKIKFYSEREFISEDIIFHIDYLQKNSRIAIIPDPLYFYCANEVSLSTSFRFDRFERYKILRAEISRKVSLIGDISQFQPKIDRMFIGYTRSLFFSLLTYNLSFLERLKILKGICSDKVWMEIFKSYPYRKLPLKHQSVLILIKYKLIFPLYGLMLIERIFKSAKGN